MIKELIEPDVEIQEVETVETPRVVVERRGLFELLAVHVVVHDEKHPDWVNRERLAQSMSDAVGLALAERQLGRVYNRPNFPLIDHATYAVINDEQIASGQCHEAAALAGEMGLGKLVLFWDCGEQSTTDDTIAHTGDAIAARFHTYDWHIMFAPRVCDLVALSEQAKAANDKPTLVICDNVYFEQWGSEETAADDKLEAYRKWRTRFHDYLQLYPQMATLFARGFKGDLGEGWQAALPVFGTDNEMSTRAALVNVIVDLKAAISSLVDVSAEINTPLLGRYGTLTAIASSVGQYGGALPYLELKANTVDAALPAIRTAAREKQSILYIVVEDGVNDAISTLRTIDNLWVFRPADPNEAALGWQTALERQDGPTAIVVSKLTQATLPQDVRGALQGGYLLSGSDRAQAILLASGAEVEVALEAQAQLKEWGIASRVVSMPCWELFEAQSREYQRSVLPMHLVTRVAIESGSAFGWERYLGTFGKIAVDHSAESAVAIIRSRLQ